MFDSWEWLAIEEPLKEPARGDEPTEDTLVCGGRSVEYGTNGAWVHWLSFPRAET